MAILNVIIEDSLKQRIDKEKEEQKRTIRALVELAFEHYFAALDAEDKSAA